MTNFQIEQLRQLPQRRNETWQGDVLQLPVALPDESGEPFEPCTTIWVSASCNRAQPSQPCSLDEITVETAWQSLVEFATEDGEGGYRPGRIEVRRTDWAKEFGRRLADVDIEVVCTEQLNVLDELAAHLVQHAHAGAEPLPGLLDGEGVTVARARSFAEAACAFYKAEPWRHFTDMDLVRVASPNPPEPMRHFTVLGAGGHTYGLGFYSSPDDLWQMHASDLDPLEWLLSRDSVPWSVHFSDPTDLPPADVELWREQDFPVASPQAYPMLCQFSIDDAATPPDAGTLSFAEGLLRALAETTDEQIDTGRWSVRVPTADGEVEFVLELPDLLDPPDAAEFRRRGIPLDRRALEQVHVHAQRLIEEHGAETHEEMNELVNRELVGKTLDAHRVPARSDRERAQDLCYEAWSATGRRQLQLARQALELWPDCADAFVILAERAGSPEEAAPLYEKAVAAGERALGRELFEQEFDDDESPFWADVETRPYMRARYGLAQCLDALDKPEQAVVHLRELLRLNPNDNQRVRYRLIALLIELDCNAEARRLLGRYEEPTAHWSYLNALAAFHKNGDTPSTQRKLDSAVKTNPHVLTFLLDDSAPPYVPDSYSIGSKEEAICCLMEIADAVDATTGAMDWLRRYRTSKRTRSRGSSTGRKKRQRNRRSR